MTPNGIYRHKGVNKFRRLIELRLTFGSQQFFMLHSMSSQMATYSVSYCSVCSRVRKIHVDHSVANSTISSRWINQNCICLAVLRSHGKVRLTVAVRQVSRLVSIPRLMIIPRSHWQLNFDFGPHAVAHPLSIRSTPLGGTGVSVIPSDKPDHKAVPTGPGIDLW